MAAYLAKYIAKAIDENRALGHHRYERSQGLSVTTIEADGDFAELVTHAWRLLGGRIVWGWWSGDDDSWRGPITLALRGG